MNSSAIRIGIIGLDHWYAAIPFAQKAATQAGITLQAIVDRDPARSRRVTQLTGCTRTSTDPASVIDDPHIDAVACFTSVDQSPELCIAAARAGKHIVAVKPLAMTLAEADRVVEAVEGAGVHFIPSESRRSSPLALRLSEWIHSGRLGELRSGTFAMNSSIPAAWPGTNDPGWWVDQKRAPGGGWIDHAVYQIDRMQWLFDSPVATVTGQIGNIAHPSLEVEDYGHAIFHLDNGAVVTLEDTWIASPGASTTRAQLVGSEGSLFYDSTLNLFGTAAHGAEWTVTKMPTDAFDTLDVLGAVMRETTSLSSTVRTARQTLALCLAFYDAARQG